MSFIANLRDSGRLSQILTALAALFGFLLLMELLLSGMLVYSVLSPMRTGGTLNPSDLLGRPSEVTYSVPGGTSEGWFFPGLRTAPTIIICHGYESNREELLTLVTALQEHQYNVFLFDFSGHGRSKRFSTLGYRETREVLAIVRALAERDDVDRTRFGVWGSNLGGFAALSAAAQDRRIRAVAVDSIYDAPSDLFNQQMQRSALSSFPLAPFFSRLGFRIFSFAYRKDPTLSTQVTKLQGVPKLFVQASDSPELSQATLAIFLKAPEPREQLVVSKSRYALMSDDERRTYENAIVRFFLINLPPVVVAPH